MDLIEELNENLVEFFDRFTSWENSVIQQSSMTVSGAHAIEKLGHNGSMSMKDLSKSLGVTTGTVTVTVDRLEKGGYAVRDRSESDRRSYHPPNRKGRTGILGSSQSSHEPIG